jgi:hypothetical protein
MECVPNGVIVRRGDGRRRPAFMEALPPGGPPRDHFVRLVEGGAQMRNRSSSSSSSSSLFPDDAQYIGYLSDDERVNIDDTVANIARRRRRQLLGTDGDISFSVCLLFVVLVVLVLVLVGGPPRR